MMVIKVNPHQIKEAAIKVAKILKARDLLKNPPINSKKNEKKESRQRPTN